MLFNLYTSYIWLLFYGLCTGVNTCVCAFVCDVCMCLLYKSFYCYELVILNSWFPLMVPKFWMRVKKKIFSRIKAVSCSFHTLMFIFLLSRFSIHLKSIITWDGKYRANLFFFPQMSTLLSQHHLSNSSAFLLWLEGLILACVAFRDSYYWIESDEHFILVVYFIFYLFIF